MSFAVCCCNFSEGPWLIKNLLLRFTGRSVFVIWRNKTMWERRSRTNNRFIVEVTITAGWPAHNYETRAFITGNVDAFLQTVTHTHTHTLTVFISTWRSSSTFFLVWVKQVADSPLIACLAAPPLPLSPPMLLPTCSLSLSREANEVNQQLVWAFKSPSVHPDVRTKCLPLPPPLPPLPPPVSVNTILSSSHWLWCSCWGCQIWQYVAFFFPNGNIRN